MAQVNTKVSEEKKLSSEEIRAKHKEFLFPSVTNYYKESLVIDHGNGMYVYDPEGNKYLDFFGGILTISVGHCNPKVTSKIAEQVGKLQHTSTLYPNEKIISYCTIYGKKKFGNNLFYTARTKI